LRDGRFEGPDGLLDVARILLAAHGVPAKQVVVVGGHVHRGAEGAARQLLLFGQAEPPQETGVEPVLDRQDILRDA
jgi:hypothetical protein